MANEPLPIKVSGSALTIGDRRWRAEHLIVDAHQVDDVVCVLLDYMSFPNHQQARNLRGYSLSGRLLWIAEHPTNQTTDCYTSIQPASRASQILAGNFAGYNCVIDARTGELLDSVFTK